MKTSNPYGPGDNFKVPPETITSERSKNGGKGKQSYPSGIKGCDVSTGQKSGKMKHRAYTPGGPSGS
jgi:hypothetical protein